MQYFINLFKTSKTQMGFFLTLIFITAFLNNPSQKILLVFLLSIISAVSADLLFVRLRNIKWFFPSAALVTGSIVGLLTAPDFTWYIPVVVGVIAMFSKNFIRFSNRHIFNPAGFGLLVGAIIFRHAISWWAVSWQQFSPAKGGIEFIIYFLILLSPSLISSYRMGRYRITVSFLLTYSFLILLSTKYLILNTILDPTVLFFSIVMLPEPLTSPNNHTKQIIFGIFVALISLIVSSPILNSQFSTFNSIDPLVFSLLLGNLVFFKLR